MTMITPEALRALADDDDLMATAHLAIEDEVIDRRDRMMFVMNRNGISVHNYDGSPSEIIRIGTREAVRMALLAIADHLEQEGRSR